MITVRTLTFAAVLIAAVGMEAVAEPVNRWGTDFNRATRVPRANDIYMRRPPVPVYRVKPAPEVKTYKKESVPRPRYGTPDPAIERIPET